MARIRRRDEPGALHHVFNRGIARRTMFESRDDIRHFLSCVARAVHRREISVISYSVLTTHYHLFVRSMGDLAAAMQRIQTAYTRRFNRGRKRDGSLTRGRYGSRRVECESYVRALVAYIDRNPVAARLVAHPIEYEFGSARDYAHEGGRIWLDADAMSSISGSSDLAGPGAMRGYISFLERMDARFDAVIDKRLDRNSTSEDGILHLLHAAPSSVRSWMQRKALLADGTKTGCPVAPASLVVSALDREGAEIETLKTATGSRKSALSSALRCAMLRFLAGLSSQEVSRHGIPRGSVGRHFAKHRSLMRSSPAYAAYCGELAHRILREVRSMIGADGQVGGAREEGAVRNGARIERSGV